MPLEADRREPMPFGNQRDNGPQPSPGIGWFDFQSTLQLIQPLAHSSQAYARILRWRAHATQPFFGHSPSMISHFQDRRLDSPAKANFHLGCP